MKFLGLLLTVLALEPLEPNDGKILFGSWFNRIKGDTPVLTEQRLGYKPLSLWQADLNIGETIKAQDMIETMNLVRKTGSDAMIYITVYPMYGYDHVADSALRDFVDAIKRITDTGHKVFIRYASEMNGSWFSYGQKPTDFIESWKRVVKAVRDVCPRESIAFIWAPNSGNGYPFPGSHYSVYANDTRFDKTLDTNNNGQYDTRDDPYTPFYPGDEWVDWIGMSIYHYGEVYPWETNVLPIPGQVEAVMTGKPGWGFYNIYQMFCAPPNELTPSVTKGNKPFFITETGSTTHTFVIKDSPGFVFPPIINETERVAVLNGEPATIPSKNLPLGRWVIPEKSSPADRVPLKQTWWRQIFNETFLKTFPKVKAACFFEFQKFEESSWRDFTNLGDGPNEYGPNNSPPTGGNLVLDAFREDVKGPMGELIQWGRLLSENRTGGQNPYRVFFLPRGSVYLVTLLLILPVGWVLYHGLNRKFMEPALDRFIAFVEDESDD